MEMEEQLTVDKQYLKGFNQGYMLAEHTPDLVKQLLKNNLPENEYFTGFKAGRKHFELEKTKAKLKAVTKVTSPDKNQQNPIKGRTK